MVITFARLISILFHPLLIPTYSFALCIFVFPEGMKPIPASFYSNFLILIFLITFMLPLLLIGILRTMKVIDSLHIPDRKQRVLPFVVISILYVSITVMFYQQSKIHPSENFMKLMMIIDSLVIVSTIITIVYRVSIHALAMWGVVGILIGLNVLFGNQGLFISLIAITLLTGVVMSSRLLVGAHSLDEVMWGAATGLAIGLSGIFILFT